MFLRSLKRSWPFRLLSFFFLAWNSIDVLNVHRNLYAAQKATGPRSRAFPNERIYIASLHWNNEAILRSHWNDAVAALAKFLGPENTYVSIYESGSWDDSKGALRDLDKELGELGIPRTIILEETTHADELEKAPGPGWIATPRGTTELRRIPYLARLRNATLKPLEELAKSGKRFDKILFLNDVVFSVSKDLNVREATYLFLARRRIS